MQIYAERYLNLAQDAFQGEGQNAAELAPIERQLVGYFERQLVGYFKDGLVHDSLKIKVMRENPEDLWRAVAIVMGEQNLRKKIQFANRAPVRGAKRA